MEGYLQQKKMIGAEKQFVELKHHYLFCYNNHKKSKLIEKINLTAYKIATISKTKKENFELNPSGMMQLSLVFIANDANEAKEWVGNINNRISPAYDGCNKANAKRIFKFGEWRDYWNNGKYWRDPKFMSGKYKSMKEEAISNKLCGISVDAFNDAYNKASYLIQQSPFIKTFVSDQNFEEYGISKGSTITIDNVLSVILYTDYDSLSYKFSTTFRKSSITSSTYNNKSNETYIRNNPTNIRKTSTTQGRW